MCVCSQKRVDDAITRLEIQRDEFMNVEGKASSDEDLFASLRVREWLNLLLFACYVCIARLVVMRDSKTLLLPSFCHTLPICVFCVHRAALKS